jgi:hypothetical protein
MTNKLFYQLAADEVAQSNIDQGLWIKVVADMPTASKIQQQAKYIQLRAGELAVQSAVTRVAGTVPTIKRVLKLAVGIVVVGFVIIVGGIIIVEHQDDQRMRESAIGFGATIEQHVGSGEADSNAYKNQLIDMNNMCEAWEGQRLTDRWIKGTDEQNAPAFMVCKKVSSELKRLVPR